VTLYRTLGIAPPPWAWEPSALGTDLLHKGVYAAVTGVVYERLDRDRRPTQRSVEADRHAEDADAPAGQLPPIGPANSSPEA
jgi:hypothetical protein